ncbi:putative clathrin assembly protein [Hibiscus syriacus]|uniref:Clathrin assembly protein n=2 Tax=Hibiscus syriacus TaxID=106335 RepID=A0A6A2WXK3_HIBSY|nr:putative clathrin assembly protein [Hibiscus syriacus]
MGVDIQTKLRLALGSMKDHASIGKALVYNHDGKPFSDIEIAVLRATGHDNGPIEDKYMHEILFLVSNSPGSVPFLAERISRRLCKTRDCLVALKTLSLIHRLLRGGNRCFERELRNSHVSGHLQMSATNCFRNSSFSFLRSYAAYLEERVGWAITQAGKLEPVMFNGLEFGCYEEKSVDMVFRKLPKCQAFMDRVLDCSPIDVVPPADNLAQAAMGNTLKESFQVYIMYCEVIEILINMFFDLTTPARTLACDILKRASRQSKELADLYETCKRVMENKNLEYPRVQIITMDHVLALEQCSSFMSTSSSTGKQSEKEGDEDDTSSSSNQFSFTLETKISKVWVVFDEDDGELQVPVGIV